VAGGGEVHEVFDVVEMGGEGEEELGGEREKAGWVGHGSGVVYSTSFTCYPLAIYFLPLAKFKQEVRMTHGFKYSVPLQ
jgi:hypothetical protein